PPEFNPPYDILTLDPPYGAPGIADVIERVSRPGLVARGGFVVLEHDKRWSPPADPGALRLRRTRLYGDTGVTLWQRDEEAEE
ncbi:MAG: RsmD family RNA methyltransferase, partial [Chloroflexi bacterium]|nr:RsmD family RNA methyltransferase [Chloroflexota bacterium]